MLAAILHFDEEVVLVLGMTPNDFELLAEGAPAPIIDLEELARDTGCPRVDRIQVVFGLSEESINERIQKATGREATPLQELFGGSSLEEEYTRESQISPAHVAANQAEELAIKKARAKLN